MIEDRHPVAKEVLEQKMKEIPIIVNRAPSLWKYNLVALYPKIHNRKGVAINMLIAKGLAGDLDGDTVNVHVPITPQAVEDAKKMLPSRIAVDPRTRLGLLYKPSQEADLGIKLGLTPKENEKPVKVQTPDDVGLLLRSGKIDWRTPVEVNNG
jgi:DNA-directed RNA polymerase subunit beta'